jgi:hypothetical protein
MPATSSKIVVLVGSLQVVSMFATIWTSSTLKTWTQTSALWLQCRGEGHTSREWESYEFDDGQVVCEAGTETWSVTGGECLTPCKYVANTTLSLTVRTSLSCDVDEKYTGALNGSPNSCDCSCDVMAIVQPPPFSILAISFFSQSCMACVVGVSLGFRESNLDVWKELWLKHSPRPTRSNKNIQVLPNDTRITGIHMQSKQGDDSNV